MTRKITLITGGAKRIGKAMAIHLAENGWSIAIHYNRSETEAAGLVKTLQQNYPQQLFHTFSADLSSEKETEMLIPAVIEKMGKPELLINNASVFEANPLKSTSADFLKKMMSVNFTAPFILTRDFANFCRQGVIVNFADTRITTNKWNFAAYSLAKKSLWELTKMSAVEFAPAIRVNAIAPGLTLAPADKSEDYLWELAKHIPMQRPGGLEPVLKSLDFILNNDYLTGQLLFCDGGENLGRQTGLKTD